MNNNKEIETLKDLLVKIEGLDNENEEVKSNIKYLKNKITELKLEEFEVKKHITFREKLRMYLKSKTIILNFLLIILECLNLFTDIFTSSQSGFLNTLGIAIPILTVYFRLKATTNY